MIWLIIGLMLWYDAHFFKSVLPEQRAAMDRALGENRARGIMAGVIILSVILMIIGYRSMPHTPIYTPMAGMGHLNNLMMFVAIALMGAGNSKGRMRSLMRHPMLIGTIIWCVSHLLVNGDLAAILLFGGIAIWAVMSIFIINNRDGAWERPAPGPPAGDIKLLVIACVLFAIIAGLHTWIGYNPFLGTYS